MEDSLNAIENKISDLQSQLAEMEELKKRCQKAETDLETLKNRNIILGDSAPFGIFTIDANGWFTGMNRKMHRLLPWLDGKDKDHLNLYEVEPLVQAGVSEDIRRCMQTNKAFTRDYECVQDNQKCLQLRFYLCPFSDGADNVAGTIVFAENFTHLRLAQAAAEESEQRYRLLFQSAPIPMVERDASALKVYLKQLRESGVTDLDAYLQQNPQEIKKCLQLIKTADFNDAFLELMETQDKAILSEQLPQLAMGSQFPQLVRELILVVDQGTVLPEREWTMQTFRGNRKRVISRAMILAGHESTLARIVISIIDISKRVEAEEAVRASEKKFREQSLRDNLTGLYNQRYLYYSLPLLIQTAKSNQTPLSLAFMDLDNFKQVVDTHGHLNGSRAIQEVAATINQILDPPAYAVAYAGDEFVVVLPNFDLQMAEIKARQIQSKILATEYLSDQGKNIHIQASCGIAAFPEHADDAEALLSAADTALFSVKGSYKGAVALFGITPPSSLDSAESG